jgi:hypothetical protein
MSKYKKEGQMVSIIPKVSQLVSKLNSTSKITQITPLIQISSLYIKDKKVGKMISNISKVGQFISKFRIRN